jgi:NTE family protein
MAGGEELPMTPSVPREENKVHVLKARSEFGTTALLLQGGGALGAYQAGVYEALAEADVLPNWVAGISIGAINGAIIAGNKPAERVAKLRAFWEQITAWPMVGQFQLFNDIVERGGLPARNLWNQVSSGVSVSAGTPGFFKPRLISPWASPEGTLAATSYYDTSAFKETLEKFVDFDLLNSDSARYTVAAVNVRTGNYELFDSTKREIGPEHVMASGALPPEFPAVEIEGEHYWDGGVVSNTPLEWLAEASERDTLVFQVDLWCAQGRFPRNMMEVSTRLKEIQYSSRTRAVTNRLKEAQKLRRVITKLYDKLPDNMKSAAEIKELKSYARCLHYNIVHLIYRAEDYEGYSKDYDFSRLTMQDHWKAGYNDTIRTLRHREIFALPKNSSGVAAFDFNRS